MSASLSGRNAVWLCLITIIAAMFYGLSPMVAEQDSLYRNYAPLVEVDALIRREGATVPPDARLVEGALRGLMRQVDPYCGYVAPDELAAFQRRNTGEYVGVGVELGMVQEAVTVIAAFEDEPAHRVGIRGGDVLLAVDGRNTKGLSVFDVEGLLHGRPGAGVTVRVRQPGGRLTDVALVRAHLQKPVVKGVRRHSDGSWDYVVDPVHNLAYIRISQFARGVTEHLDRTLAELVERKVAGLVLDLRFNPGGLMPEAIALADRFLESGPIVTTVSRREIKRTYAATPGNDFPALPLAVLVNQGSASSSEIVAGALQDRHRAVLVGERTFGKGSVQNLIQVQRGRARIKLTVALYQLPGGRSIHRTADNVDTDEWGIVPDFIIPLDDEERDAIHRSRAEIETTPIQALPRHSASPDSTVAQAEGSGPEEPIPGDDPSGLRPDVRETPAGLYLDRQLRVALDALIEQLAPAFSAGPPS